MLDLGASFRKARESQNLSIDKIAGDTRINSRFLEAIENERFDLLPGGIFNRGFIRTYALRLGLDPEEAIQGYEKLVRAVEAEPAQQEPERPRGKTTKIPVYYVALAGLLSLVVIYYFLTRHTDSQVIAPNAPLNEATAPPPAEPPLPVETPAPEQAVVIPAVAATPPVSPAPAPAPTPVVTAAQPASTGSVVVELEVQEESWFKLSSDGSDVVPSEVLAPGTVRRYTASNSMDLSIGNAAGVTLRVNGQPVTSLGRAGQVRNLTITPGTSASSLNVR
jgi:cytoskeleton protein RodZ